MLPESDTWTQYVPAVAVPLKAVAPLFAWSFLAIPTAQVVPSQDPMSTPSANVVNGATAVRLTCTEPVAVTVNGNAALPSWTMLPENTSVMVAGAGAVGEGTLVDAHATNVAEAIATRTDDKLRMMDARIKAVIPV
jgi:hypothetical protein